MAKRKHSPSTRPDRDHGPTTQAEKDRRLLTEATFEVQNLLARLAALLPEPAGLGPSTGTIGRHAPESSEPWNAEVADVFWRVWFGALKLANQMQRGCDQPETEWTRSSHQAQARAWGVIRNLASAVPEDQLARARVRVEGWVNAAQRVRDIDEQDSWVAVPRAPGLPPPVCPYCKTLSLRMAKAREEVRCFYPGCTDLEGRPTKARMEPGRMTGEGTLVFGDDTVVSYREGE